MTSIGERADKKKLSQRSKRGETLRWNAKKKSGWVYDGTWWRHYRNGKPTGKKEKHRISAKSPVAKTITRVHNLVNPFHESYALKERKRKHKARKEKERKERLKLKHKQQESSVNEVLDSKPVKKKTKVKQTKPKVNTSKTKEETPKVKQTKPKVNTSKTKTPTSKPKKRLTAREKMRAKNVARFGEAHIKHLEAKQVDFKRMKKKEISKEDFIKKYPRSITAQRAQGLRR